MEELRFKRKVKGFDIVQMMGGSRDPPNKQYPKVDIISNLLYIKNKKYFENLNFQIQL